MDSLPMTNEEGNWGMACHLAALAMFTHIPFASILGPLIVWLIKKDQYPFVNDQGKEALNFQITVTIASLACGFLFFLVGLATGGLACILFPVVWVILIANAVFVVIAAVNANKGIRYRYPFAIRFLR